MVIGDGARGTGTVGALMRCRVSDLAAAGDRRRLMTIGYRVMGSGPGPERIGGGRGRFVWSPGMGRLGRHVCLPFPSLSVWACPAGTATVSSSTRHLGLYCYAPARPEG